MNIQIVSGQCMYPVSKSLQPELTLGILYELLQNITLKTDSLVWQLPIQNML